MKVSTSGGATGTWKQDPFKGAHLSMNFGGTVVTATLKDNDKLIWSNNNVWTKKPGSEDRTDVRLGTGGAAGIVFWKFLDGTNTMAYLRGNRLEWLNGNVWTRTSAPALEMTPCTGEDNQK